MHSQSIFLLSDFKGTISSMEINQFVVELNSQLRCQNRKMTVLTSELSQAPETVRTTNRVSSAFLVFFEQSEKFLTSKNISRRKEKSQSVQKLTYVPLQKISNILRLKWKLKQICNSKQTTHIKVRNASTFWWNKKERAQNSYMWNGRNEKLHHSLLMTNISIPFKAILKRHWLRHRL